MFLLKILEIKEWAKWEDKDTETQLISRPLARVCQEEGRKHLHRVSVLLLLHHGAQRSKRSLGF